MTATDGAFELWDLRVEVVGDQAGMVCSHTAGDYFEVHGENLSFPPGQSFSLYALAAILPLLPAKQRTTHAHDWMTTDAEIACPDPHCAARFRITRVGRSTFLHSETTVVPLGVPDATREDGAAGDTSADGAGGEARVDGEGRRP
jgi:uncharacterized repeat protein (TIGR04076 family)